MEYQFNVLFWLYKSKMNSKGLAPIFMRITVNGGKTEFSSGVSVNPQSWNAQKGIVKGSGEEAKETNKRLELLKSKASKVYNDLIGQDIPISAELIKKRLNNEEEAPKTLLGAIQYHNALVKDKIGIETTLATYRKYESLRRKVLQFLSDKKNRADVFLKELNHQFIVEFEAFLKTVYKMGHNSTIKDIQFLKKVIHMSVANSWLQNSPFSGFKCSINNVDRGYLTEGELHAIENKVLSIERLAIIQDLFILSCYTGLSYSDVRKLTLRHIITQQDGSKWIIVHRTKTKIRSPIPLLPKAQEIISKYSTKSTEQGNAPFLPVPSNQTVNAYLKEIGDLCGITKKLTYHLARHTFATTVTLANGVPIETVGKMLGHANLKTTQVYARVVDTKIARDMSMLMNKKKAGE